jgi:hypothetical protein
MKRQGRVIIICGGTGRGKSTYIKEKIKEKPHLINDIKNEYKRGFTVYEKSGDREGFMQYVDENCEKMIIVMEEASWYLSHKHYSTTAEKIFVNKYRSENTYLIVFHSIRKIPLFIYDYADAMVLFKTKDQLHRIKNHPQEVLDAFEVVNNKSIGNKFFNTYIELDDV